MLTRTKWRDRIETRTKWRGKFKISAVILYFIIKKKEKPMLSEQIVELELENKELKELLK